MAIPLSHDALWTSYEDVRLLVYQTCHAFARRHGGEFDELLSAAHEHFVAAHAAYDPTRAKYTTWVRNAVWWGLLEDARTAGRLTGRTAPYTHDLPDEPGFDLGAFLGGLSADARTVARLALEAERRTSRDRRRAVLDFLHDIKWTAERIAESFGELREALSIGCLAEPECTFGGSDVTPSDWDVKWTWFKYS